MDKVSVQKSLMVFHAMSMFEKEKEKGYKTIEEIHASTSGYNPNSNITKEEVEEILSMDYHIGCFSIQTNTQTRIKAYRLAICWRD